MFVTGVQTCALPIWLCCSAACGILVGRPGIEPVYPALPGGFFNDEPPGKPVCLDTNGETHSSILAWGIPRTEEPGGLQSMKSLRVGLD